MIMRPHPLLVFWFVCCFGPSSSIRRSIVSTHRRHFLHIFFPRRKLNTYNSDTSRQKTYNRVVLVVVVLLYYYDV